MVGVAEAGLAKEAELAEEAEMEAAMEEETSPATSPHRYPSLPGCSC